MSDLKAFTAAVMGIPVDVLEAAREAAAKECEQRGDSQMARMIREGHGDHHRAVQAACIAIVAERERCAEVVNSAKKGIAPIFDGYIGLLDIAEKAILGQQEPAVGG